MSSRHGLASRRAAHVTTSQWGMYFLPSDTPRPTALTSDYCSVGPTLTARAATSQRRSEAAATANVEEKGNRRGMLLMMIDRLRASAGRGGSGDDPLPCFHELDVFAPRPRKVATTGPRTSLSRKSKPSEEEESSEGTCQSITLGLAWLASGSPLASLTTEAHICGKKIIGTGSYITL